jgi:hypothetical protein
MPAIVSDAGSGGQREALQAFSAATQAPAMS